MNEEHIESLLESVFNELDNFERAFRRKKAIELAPINDKLKERLNHKLKEQLESIAQRLEQLDKEFTNGT